MRWIKWFGGLLLLLLTGCAAIVLFVVTTYEDADYRYALIYAVNRVTGGVLAIDGAFTVDLSLTPSLSASDIRFTPAVGGGEARIEQFDIRIQLAPMLHGLLWIEQLDVSDVEIDLPLAVEPSSALPGGIDLIPVVEHAALNAITLRWRRVDHDPVTVSIDELSVAPDESGTLWRLQGAGRVAGYACQIEGRTGNLDRFVHPSRPFPVELALRFAHGRLAVDGSVAAPAEGAGIDLAIDAEFDEVARVLHAFQYSAPALGRLTGRARLTGRFDALGLDRIRLDVRRNNAVQFHVAGSVSNLLTGDGIALRFSGVADERAILVWLLPENLPPVSRLELEGALARSNGLWAASDIRIRLSSVQRFVMEIRGRTDIVDDFSAPQPFRAMDLGFTFTSPTTAASRPILSAFFREMGAVRFRGRLTSPSDDYLALEEIDGVIGNDALRFTMTGRIGKVPVAADVPSSDIDLDLSLEAADSQALRRVFGGSIPDLGPVRMNAQWRGSRRASRLDGIRLKASGSSGLTVDIEGQARLGDVTAPDAIERAAGTIRVQAPTTAALEPFVGHDLPKLRAVDGRATIDIADGVLSLRQIEATTKRGDPVRMRIGGRVGRLSLAEGRVSEVVLTGTMKAKSTGALGTAFGQSALPELGAVDASFEISGNSDALALSRLAIHAGDSELKIDAKGRIERLNPVVEKASRGVDVQLRVQAPSLKVFSTVVKRALPDRGPVVIAGSLRDPGGVLAVEDIRALVGPRSTPILKVSGTVMDRSVMGIKAFNASFEAATDSVLSLFLDRPLPPLGRMELHLLMADHGDHFGIQSLDVAGRAPGWLQFEIRQTQRTPAPVYQIDASIETLNKLDRALAATLPPLGPVSVSGRLTTGADQKRFAGEIVIGETRAVTDLATRVAGGRRAVSGSIRMPVLKRADFVTRADRTRRRREPSEVRRFLFSRTPLPFDRMRLLDLGITIEAGAVQGLSKRLGPVKVGITVNRGALPASSGSRLGGQRPLVAVTDIQTVGTPRVSFRIDASHTDLRPVLRGDDTAEDGEIYAAADLISSGESLHELASHLKGQFGLIMENGVISSAELDLISLNLLRWLFSYTTGQQETVNCAVARFQVNNGVAVSDLLYLDTPTLAASGKAILNLGAETVDMIVSTQPKKALLPTGLPLRIHGSLYDPETTSIPLAEAVRDYGELIFQPVKVSRHALGYLLSLVGVERDDDAGACDQLKADVRSGS